MSAAAVPWWGSGLFTVAGTVLGASATLLLGLLNRRTERRRLSREQKETDYPELTRVAGALGKLPVWPADAGEPDDAYREIDAHAQRVAFFSPQPVSATISGLLTAARALADVITTIRAESKPGHSDRIDQRYLDRYRAAQTALDQAIAAFAEAARADLEIRTPYTLVRPEQRG